MRETTVSESETRRSHGLIAAMKKVRGAAWIGKINGGGRLTLWEWDGSTESSAAADFVLPRYDAELDALLAARYRAEYKGIDHDAAWVETILNHIERLDGHLLYSELADRGTAIAPHRRSA